MQVDDSNGLGLCTKNDKNKNVSGLLWDSRNKVRWENKYHVRLISFCQCFSQFRRMSLCSGPNLVYKRVLCVGVILCIVIYLQGGIYMAHSRTFELYPQRLVFVFQLLKLNVILV